ncbi:NAD(P)/FAD-dependent oxidoreductase, partial [Pseudoalteromonas sp. SIMBA_148]
QAEAIAEAESIEDLFNRLEKGGVLMRIDPNVRPQMFHGATISSEELKQLRRVKNIVRKGRVTCLDTDKIYFGDDSIATTPNTMHID